MDTTQHIIALIEMLAAATNRTETTISRLCSGHGLTSRRLRDGRDITIARAQRIVQWLSDHWPDADPDCRWPHHLVERPAPSPDSPAARAAADRAAEAARAREAAHRLGPDGRIADIAAFAAFHGIEPQDAYDVRRHWADGHGKGELAAPERGSERRKAWDGFVEAGDADFRSQRRELGAVMGRVGADLHMASMGEGA